MKFKVLLAVIVVLFLGFAIFNKPEDTPNSEFEPVPISAFSDAHGMSVDVNDSTKLYIATHSGLLMLEDDSELFRISEQQHDFMGFSPHPTDSNIFYTSGHPKTGGNLGFQKSSDGGRTFEKISDGIDGPVDFHSMTVSKVNPNIVYGTYQGQLQRSLDEGKSWEILDNGSLPNIVALTTDILDENVVYASTVNGLYKSIDKATTWLKVESAGDGVITVAAVHPTDDKALVTFSVDQGLLMTSDGGNSWTKLGLQTDSVPVLHFSYDTKQPSTMYALLQDLTIHKSEDEGATWKKIR